MGQKGASVMRNEKGITLLELLASMAILGIMVAGFLNLTQFNAKTKLEESRRAEALRIAEEQLNRVRVSYNSIPAKSPVTGNQVISTSTQGQYQLLIQLSDLTNTPSYTAPANNRQVYVQSVVLIKDASDPTAMIPKLLTVTVSWNG